MQFCPGTFFDTYSPSSSPRYRMISPSELPPKPETICATAWEGVVAAHFGILLERVENPNVPTSWTGGYMCTMSWDAWLQCASSGCVWCRFLERNFLEKLGGKDRQDELCLRVGRLLSWRQVVVVIFRNQEMRFHLHTAEDDPAATWIQGRSRKPHTEPFGGVLETARACVDKCIHEHDMCQAITQSPIGTAPLPTRLIDCSNPNRLHLIETAGEEREPYIALSYVWGPGDPKTRSYLTSTENLEPRRIEGIDVTSLPPTIRDAVAVTRALGVRLLWIDGLCIIQNSDSDIQNELARMRDVYRNAYLTIDAGSAASVTEGFLEDRRPLDPGNWLPHILPLPDATADGTTQATVGSVYWDALVGDSADVWHGSFGSGTHSDARSWGPTSRTVKRGWCLQERLLSTRSLVFTLETVQLRCHTITQNVDGLQHNSTFDVPRLPDAILHPDRPVGHDSFERKYAHSRWLQVVEDYTRRSLTKTSDKLVAISGLAEMFAPVLGPGYLAGLWYDTLLFDLLWKQLEQPSPRWPGCGERPPSWSWASCDKGVRYDPSLIFYGREKVMTLLAEVVSCTVSLREDKLPFCQVDGGSLSLSALLFRSQWVGPEDKNIEVDLCSSLPSGPSHVLASHDHVRLGTPWVDYDNETGVLEDVWFVPLVYQDCTGEGRYGRRPEGYSLLGLLITHAKRRDSSSEDSGTGHQREVYRRVGVCEFWENSGATPAGISDVVQMLRAVPRVLIELV